MALSDLETVRMFLLWIVAGFIAARVHDAFSPSGKRSDFEWLVEALVYTCIMVWVLRLVVRVIGAFLECDLREWVESGEDSVVAALLIMSPVLGYSVGRLVESRPWRRFLKAIGLPDRPSATVWMSVMCIPSGEQGKWVNVVLDDGRRYCGSLAVTSRDPDGQRQDLCLEEACLVGPDGESVAEFDQVYIPGERIRVVEFPQSSE